MSDLIVMRPRHRCIDCKYCTSWEHHSSDSVFTSLLDEYAQCRKTIKKVSHFSPVHGEWSEDVTDNCSEKNKNGKCSDFETRPKATWWQRFWGTEPK